MRHRRHGSYFAHTVAVICLAALGLLQGCAVVQVGDRDTAQSLIEQRDSILTQRRLSIASVGMLSMIGQAQSRCLDSLEDCLKQLKTTPSLTDEQYLSTASELYLLYADGFLAEQPHCQALPIVPNSADQHIVIRLKRSPQTATQYDDAPVKNCQKQRQNALLSSASHAYAYLFLTQRTAQQRVFDNRQIQVRDFYNVAVSRLVAEQFSGQSERQTSGEIQLRDPTRSMTLHDHGGLFEQQSPEQLVAADQLSFRGLRSINRRDGFGVEFVAVMPKAESASHVYTSRYLPISIVLRPHGDTVQQITDSPKFSLEIYNPYQHQQVTLTPQSTQNLAANFSAPYGLWLAKNNLAEQAYRSLLALDDHASVPRLYMLEPYQPNKRVIILLHGLASSPEAWVNLTNDIFGDPVLRDHYQVWQVFYPTNMPMLENRLRIQRLIESAYQQVDPRKTDKASQHSVLIGHSMGGVIGRLMVSPTDLSQTALAGFNRNEQRRLLQIPEVKNYFQLKPLSSVQRVVFVSTPFRGTDYADRWFTLVLRKIIQLPSSFIQKIDDALSRELIDQRLMQRITEARLLEFQNGASELSQRSHFMQITAPVQIKAGLPYHLIMGQIEPNSPVLDSSDGIVPYRSSHLDGAMSERVIQGGHSIQSTPEAVLELRRILRLHLDSIGDLHHLQQTTAP